MVDYPFFKCYTCVAFEKHKQNKHGVIPQNGGDEDEEDFKIKDLVIAKVNGEWIFVSGRLNPSTIVSKAIND